MGGNFKVKCIQDNGFNSLYTIGKIYEIKNGIFENDYMEIIPVNEIKDLKGLTSATWELIEEEGENKVEDLRELIKPCYVVVRRDGSICGVFEIKEGLKLQEKLDMGNCCLNAYKNDLTKYNYPDSTDIVKVYGWSETGCFDISIKDRPLIWKREEEPIKSPTQLEIESIELEQRKLADRLAKLKEKM